ncbi:MAG: tetraacyldisaccharide 4'-kinase [Planctomycetes bacterium]|nr:tetraacyldisaccharide 4'-kinase [Planctomycetota bacterium]
MRGDTRGFWPTLERCGLRVVSVPYGWGVRLRNWAFERGWKKAFAAPVPVISVGNLTLGGTGKTPCVEYIARFYRELGLRVVILSRGYGASVGRNNEARNGEAQNDEAQVLEENLPDVPHLQGADRVHLVQTAVEELESEIAVLDDGFQHRRLRRDLDIVLIDATAPWGHGFLFPRGLMREPASSLRRAHVVMLTRSDLVEEGALEAIRRRIGKAAPGLPMVETAHRPAAWVNCQGADRPLDAFAGRPVGGFCGLGNPEAFRKTLEQLGAKLAGWRVYPDHHAYTWEDIERLRVWARQLPSDAVLATTQKDLVKIRLERFGERELWALRIQLAVLKGKDLLEEKLSNSIIQPRRGG